VFGQSLHYQNIWASLLKLSDAIQSKVMSCQFHSHVYYQTPWYCVDDNIQHEIAASYHSYHTMVLQPCTILWYCNGIPYHGIVTSYHTLVLQWHTIPWYCHLIPYPGIAMAYHTMVLSPHTIPWYCNLISYHGHTIIMAVSYKNYHTTWNGIPVSCHTLGTHLT